MKIQYKCVDKRSKTGSKWYGEAVVLRKEPILEMKVTARDSYFHILAGTFQYGRFMCIPNWGIGIEIVSPADKFWNLEHLLHHAPYISKVDAISIIEALAAVYAKY